MYQLFSTKDELIVAALQATAEQTLPQYLGVEEDPRPARERMLDVFAWLDQVSSRPDYAGCPFVNTAVELKDGDHPGTGVARAYKQRLTDFFESEAAAAGAADPALLAQQLTIAFDGSGARAVVTGRPLAGLAAATATALLVGPAGWPGTLGV